MFGLFRSPRTAGTGPRVRTFLALEQLGGRDCPSGGGGGDPLPAGVAGVGPPGAGVNAAPVIVDFQAEQIGNGLFVFTGRVVDENPAGLVVTFGGSVGTVRGLTAVTDASGNFTLVVQLQTNGTDNGLVTVRTVDAQGLGSNEPFVYVSPTP